MLDSRFYLKKIMDKKIRFSLKHAVTRFLLSFIFAFIIAIVPEYTTLSSEATYMLFILTFSALLWMTEAIPAFAVAFLIIALEIVFFRLSGLQF